MNRKTLETLEYTKILERLSQCAVMEQTKETVSELEPSVGLKRVNTLQEETAQACGISADQVEVYEA